MSDVVSISRTDLEGLQQWLQKAVTTPWNVPATESEGVIKPGGEISIHDRLRIYSGSYQGRLVECMKSEYPALQLALGADLFTRFATEFLIAHPPESYTLTALGAGFPRYLRDTRPEDDELWPEFIIELATLERVFSEVYHGEGTEGSESEPSDETNAILREPGSRELRCRFPVDRYFLAAREHLRDSSEDEEPEPPEPEPTKLLVFRRDYVVKLRRLDCETS